MTSMALGGVSLRRDIEDIAFEFANSKARLVVAREIPRLPTLKLSDLAVGQEVETPFWIAELLVASGVAKFRDEEQFDLTSLSKTHWKETIQTSKQITALEPNFYFLLRRFLRKLEGESRKAPSKAKDLEKAENLARDIVNCRLRKIVSIAAAPKEGSEPPKGLTPEEEILFRQIAALMQEWRSSILNVANGI